MKVLEILIGSGDEKDTPVKESNYSEHPLIGKYVIVRCRDAGVHAGELISIDGQNVTIKNSRRMWRWWCASEMSLSGVARKGINGSKSKIAGILEKPILLMGACEVIEFENYSSKESVKSAEIYNEQ